MQPLIVPYASRRCIVVLYMGSRHPRAPSFSPPTTSLTSPWRYVLKFSRRSGRRLPPLPLIRFSLDNLGESARSVSALLHIIASATSTTGFICWRRATFDTLASQAGLPLSPALALFPASRGEWEEDAERAFNEILTLALRAAVDI